VQWIAELARHGGPLPAGSYRVVVVEATGSATHHDFPALETAHRYAEDAASEEAGPLAYVLDSDFNLIERGAHYTT
jgi:hypothetical protein